MRRKLEFIRFLLGWPLSILALFFTIKLIIGNTAQIPSLSNISWYFVALSILCFISYFVLRSIIWQQIIKETKINIPHKQSMFLWSSSELKRYIPGNIWSFLGRIALFSAKKVRSKDLLKGLLIESELIVLSSALVSFFGLPIIFNIVHL